MPPLWGSCVPAIAGVEFGRKMTKPKGSYSQGPHVPVLLAEVLEALAPLDGARILDGTFGAGGYSRALLEAGASVVALDRDPSVLPHVERLKADFPNQFSFVPGTFSNLDELAGGPVDGDRAQSVGRQSHASGRAGSGGSQHRPGKTGRPEEGAV